MSQITMGDITADVVLKDIKNVHLSVYPPTGRVRISAPTWMSLETIRLFAISKLDWIRQQQQRQRAQERAGQLMLKDGCFLTSPALYHDTRQGI